jgi:holo-[acyl-carrier protein] synthase
MIIGIGTDLIEVKRVLKACEKENFQRKIYTNLEIQLASKDKVKLAGNFAVKEAVSKMFGTGFYGVRPTDIEVLRDDLGKPYINLYNAAKELAEKMAIKKIHVTITNTREYASAFVVGEGQD